MIAPLSPEEIAKAYRAYDLAPLVLDVLLSLYNAQDTEDDVNRAMHECYERLQKASPSYAISVHPISIMSMAYMAIELLKDAKIDTHILERDLFIARNLMFRDVTKPANACIIQAFAEAVVEVPEVNAWKDKVIQAIPIEIEKVASEHPALRTSIAKAFMAAQLAYIQEDNSIQNVIRYLLMEQSMGAFSQSFCEQAFKELNDILGIDGAVKMPDKKSLVDQLFANVPGGVHFDKEDKNEQDNNQ